MIDLIVKPEQQKEESDDEAMDPCLRSFLEAQIRVQSGTSPSFYALLLSLTSLYPFRLSPPFTLHFRMDVGLKLTRS